MNYQIALDPRLALSPAEFVTTWNQTPECDDAALKASLPAAVAGVLGVSAEEVVKGWEAAPS
jgi:hypothetical protein